MTVMEVGPAGELKKISNAYYENCRFTIDSPVDDERISQLVRTHYPVIEFRYCLIVYRGGEFICQPGPEWRGVSVINFWKRVGSQNRLQWAVLGIY